MRRGIRNKKNEIAIRNDLANTYNSEFGSYRNIVEYMSVFRNFKIDCSELILEVGAGTGRFTGEFVRKGAEVVAVDYSKTSLRINRSRCNCHAILADLCFLPFRSSVFDKAASINVFQHVPTWKSRIQGLREIWRTLKRDSPFLITAYNYPILSRFQSRHKQAYRKARAGLLYYYSFNRSEFECLLLSIFSKIIDIRGILTLISIQELLHRTGLKKIALLLEIFFEKTFLSYLLGSFLFAVCQK
jgi:ubiquinone/menaquinone biosynthesis C-methylase UbiE